MLKGIPKIISPDLLKALAEMGHGDMIVIADASYPSRSKSNNVIRYDGVNASQILEAILTLMPLDQFTDCPVKLMDVIPEQKNFEPPIWNSFTEIINKYEYFPLKVEYLERHEFYDCGAKAYATIASGETALYGCIILTKGVISTE